MISIVRESKGVKIEEVWFSQQKDNDKKADIISYCQTPTEFAVLKKHSRTFITDLTKSEEALWNNIHKSCQQQIRKAQREGISTTMAFSESLTADSIREFVFSHHLFLEEKKLPSSKNETEYLTLLWESGNLAISKALWGDKILACHVTIYDSEVARGLFSVSHYRSDPCVNKNMVGRANRLLHYTDMLSFKNHGGKIYDWGGISDREEIRNITDFKSRFGGVEIDTFYVDEAVSLKGKLVLETKKIITKYNDKKNRLVNLLGIQNSILDYDRYRR
ncbi:MAG: hypothetical protein HGA49_01190 [Eubacteriaceae bacterium]|nr:hypothetical protein [Eubacteriaceae bacterium]